VTLDEHPASPDAFSEEKEELLAFLLNEKGFSFSPVSIIRPRKRTGPPPLSFAQERLWFLCQLVPDNCFYNMPAVVGLNGSLDVMALEQSLNEIVRRHEALRTTFAVVNGQPVQVINSNFALTLHVVDVGELPEAWREATARQWAVEYVQQPFDLGSGPLIRACLLQLDETRYVLILALHHIAADGWSLGILVQELTGLYSALSKGAPSPFAPLPIQYADFTVWQREQLQGQALETHLDYWRKQLGDLPILALPTDHPRPAVPTFQGRTSSFVLSKTLTESLVDLSQQEQVSLYMLLLAAFQVLLYRYSGQSDIAVGSPIANRTQAGTDGLIGFFVNTLVLRANLTSDFTFRKLLGQVRQVTLEAFAHQDLPFEKLVEELHPERDLSRNPLFQVMFALQNAPLPPLELPGLTLKPWDLDTGTVRVDLEFHLGEGPEGLHGLIAYSTDLFQAETIASMSGHYRTLLEGIVTNPDRRIWDLPLLPEDERRRLLVEWNETATDYARDQCIHEMFEAQVERTPDVVAVVFADQHLTYWELNRRANQLAHYLQALGVGPEVLVGICMERSLEMVVGLLGILKAGGAYVPLDPAYPAERLAFMLADTGVPVLLTQERLSASLPRHTAWTVCLDADWTTLARESAALPAGADLHALTAENTAYVMYTSGSTGSPKGIRIPHRAINRLVWNTNYVQLEAVDKIAQASNASFDAATFEIWGALLHGAGLVVITQEVALSPQVFAAHLRDLKINTIFLTTALFNVLAREAPGTFGSLQHLLFGGEAADPRWVRAVLETSPPERLLHMYGPTESTTFTTWHQVKQVPEGATTVSIGRPLSNTQVYILNDRLEPVPARVPGELYIGGDGLARDYLNRPELTAERFVPHPFSATPGARLYRTGDLVRYLPDGNIEFIGRVDHQVKVRGFRVELGEIEAVLSQHPGVREVVVVARHDERGTGGKRVVAYVVPMEGTPLTFPTLRSFLKDKLPDYMLPSAFVMLKTLPRTPNGKVNRLALPAPSLNGLERDLTPPRTPIESILVAIWANVLNLESNPGWPEAAPMIGVHDDFFELGGHSLLATLVKFRIEDAFQVKLPLRKFFESPTVAELAIAVAEKLAEQVDDSTLAALENLSQDQVQHAIVTTQQTLQGKGEKENG
jgi:amino acid adenylation domain-containing protein